MKSYKITEKNIQEYIEKGIIEKDQADKLLVELDQAASEQRSNGFILSFSIIGACLLGLGILSFVAANWSFIGNMSKLSLLCGGTLAFLTLGSFLKYYQKSLPKVGEALILLSAILCGVTIFLIAQIYHINAHNHWLLLLWLIGLLPLMYGYRLSSISVLTIGVLLAWISFFLFRGMNFSEYILIFLPVIYVFSAILIFTIGCFHYFWGGFEKIARLLRLTGIKLAMLAFYLLTFEFFSNYEWMTQSYFYYNDAASDQLLTEYQNGAIVIAILAILGLVLNYLKNPSKSETNKIESGIVIGVSLLLFIFMFVNPIDTTFTILFNFVYFALTIALIKIGYDRADMSLVNTGLFWIAVLSISRYIEWFYNVLEPAIFFSVLGIILLGGGILLERQRRKIKNEIAVTD